MKRLIIILACFMLTACLSACDTFPKLQFTKTQYVFVKPDDQMVQDCPQPEPSFTPDIYADVMTPKQREAALTDLTLEQMDTIAKCNKQWKALREWNAKQEQIYSDKK